MKSKNYHFKVGLFAFTLILAIIIASFWASDFRFRVNEKQYDLYFEHAVTGVQIGSPVFVKGIESGEVLSIQLAQQAKASVKVKVHIKLNAIIRLYEDSFAEIQWQGITGRRVIEIDPGMANQPLLALREGNSYKEIPTRSDSLAGFLTTLNHFFSSADETMPEIRSLISEMRQLVGQLQPMLSRAERNPTAFILGNDDEELILKK